MVIVVVDSVPQDDPHAISCEGVNSVERKYEFFVIVKQSLVVVEEEEEEEEEEEGGDKR